MTSSKKQLRKNILFRVLNYFFLKKIWRFQNFAVTLQPSIKEISGLTGFDGEMKWYVSMRRLVGYLLNLSEQKINWRK